MNLIIVSIRNENEGELCFFYFVAVVKGQSLVGRLTFSKSFFFLLYFIFSIFQSSFYDVCGRFEKGHGLLF